MADHTPHRIHLRGHWLPAGGNRFTRRFGWPRPLPDGEAAWVVAPAAVRVLVNGVELESGRLPTELPARNEMAIELAGDTADPGEVFIEVRPTSPAA